jgi:RNA polymerase sigma-70 factor, ECF subfamily
MNTIANSNTLHPCAAAAAHVIVAWSDLTAHRSYLVHYAQRRVMDPALAEDLVHDVFEAVMTGRASFAGRSALRSWLVAILKHKIVDLVRERVAHHSLEAMEDGDDEKTPIALVCPHAGPEALADHRQQLRRTLARIEALPEGLRRVVELRVLRDASTEEVCDELSISEENLFVRLHRARKQLLS